MHSHARRRLPWLVVICLLASPGAAGAGGLQGQLDGKRSELDRAQQRQGVMSSALERLSGDVDRLTGEVAALRNREAAVQRELDAVQAMLSSARHDLRIARVRLRRSVDALEEQLVGIYKSDDPDVTAVLLDSAGFDDLLSRYEYLGALQDQGAGIVSRVRELRNQTRGDLETIRAAEQEIAAKSAELARTRQDLEERERTLAAARDRQASALARTRTRVGSLQGDIGHLEKRIQAQLQAAQEEAALASPELPLIAGPPTQASSSGLIWPVSGPVTSPFGPRWGTIHEGIDIDAAEGTPIAAAADGTVVMAGWNGGYGNYTCVDHGSGFSTCYAHQSAIGVTVGQDVSQGEVIGAVGNTGHSFGAHLHFETRFNGVAEDPLGYL